MAWDEARAWMQGTLNGKLYQALLDDAAERPQRNARRKKVVRPGDMPWEMSRQGLLKHLLNEQMNTRMETVDAYMQIIPPGSRSGKHRHLAEECLYVLEGNGYDLHQDCDVEITDTYHWKPRDEVKRFDWEAGDVIYIPPATIHQPGPHFSVARRPTPAPIDETYCEVAHDLKPLPIPPPLKWAPSIERPKPIPNPIAASRTDGGLKIW